MPSQYEGAVFCAQCLTHMHPSNADPHARRHATEEVLRAAEKRVLEAVAHARLVRVGQSLAIDLIPNDIDQAIIASAENARREAQKAYDEARQ